VEDEGCMERLRVDCVLSMVQGVGCRVHDSVCCLMVYRTEFLVQSAGSKCGLEVV